MKRLIQYLKVHITLIIPFGMGGAILFFSFLTFFDFFEPYLYPLHLMQGKARAISKSVIIGPYPREAELARLKYRLGVTSVIILLDPSLLQEKALIAREKIPCEKFKLNCINFPLSSNALNDQKSQKTLHSILEYIKEHPKEKFYIHCYLGIHRVGKVEEMLLRRPR